MANEDNPQRQAGPSHWRQAAGTGLMSVGGSILASGVAEELDSPESGAAVQEAVQRGVEFVNQRWWKHEHENFQRTYGQQYTQEANRMWEEYNNAEAAINSGVNPETGNKVEPWGPDGMAARNQLMRTLLQNVSQLDIQFMQNAAKFGNNPLIGQMADQLMQHRATTLQQLMGTYPELTSQATAQAGMQKAQFESTPAMLGLEKEGKEADIELKRAQAFAYRQPKGKGKKDETFLDRVGKVPIGRLHQFFMTDEESLKLIEEEIKNLEAQAAVQIREAFPNESFADPGFVEEKVRAQRPEIERRAVAQMFRKTLTPDQLSAAQKVPELKQYFEEPEITAPDTGPVYQGRMTDSEVKKEVKGTPEKTKDGRVIIEKKEGHGERALKDLVLLARQNKFSSIEEAIGQLMGQYVNPEIEKMVGDFQGAEEIKKKLKEEIAKYLLDNWKKSDFLKSEYSTKGERKAEARRTLLETAVQATPAAALLKGAKAGAKTVEDIRESTKTLLEGIR